MRKSPFVRSMIGLVACGLVLALAACSTEASGGGKVETEGQLPATATGKELRTRTLDALEGKVAAFVPVGMGTPLTEEWSRQLKRGFEDAGMKFVVRDPNWDTSKQAESFQSLINEKPAVIVVHNFDVQLLAKLIQQAQEAGIYVIQINMVSNYKSDAFVGADTIELGRRTAADIVKACGEGTDTSHKVQIVQGDATSGYNLDVLAGGMQIFKKDPTIEIVSKQAANWDRSKAHEVTATVIQQHPDLCASWGFWDQMQYGSASAIQEAGKSDQVKVYAADASTLTCQAIRDGLFDQSYGFSVPTQGTDIVAIAKQLIVAGQPAGATRVADYTPLVKIDSANWKEPGICYDGKSDFATVK